MAISRYNYEIFLVDYLDGKLSPSMSADLMLFLEQNPDIKKELEGLNDVVLVNESTPYPNKFELKKKSFSKNGIDNEMDFLLIAAIEGILTDDEKRKLDKELTLNDKRKTEYHLYQKTIIQPISEKEYPDKASLKRVPIIPIRYSTLRRAAGVAASVGLILGIYTLGESVFNNSLKESPNRNIVISANHPIKTTPQELLSEGSVIVTRTTNRYQETNSSEPDRLDTVSKNETIRREEIIPTRITLIESKEIVIRKYSQFEQIALYIETHPNNNRLSKIEPNSYSENCLAKANVREIGVFEIIQYGVQSFGKLIGKDIRLNANKDKNGKIEKIKFESSLFAFSTSVGKDE